MRENLTDGVAATATITSPAWVPILNQINCLLTFASLTLGIAFLLWRWWKAARKGVAE